MRLTFAVWILLCSSALRAGQARAVDEHVGDLKSTVAAVRANGATSLGRLGDRAAVPALLAALKDPEKGVRREAAKALGVLRDARAVTPLIAALRDDDRNVRVYAAYALGEIGDPKAADALLRALRDPAWCVRDQAAWALRGLGDPSMLGPLADALKDKNADAPHILWLIRHVGGDKAVGPLAALLKAPDPATRAIAMQALSKAKAKEAAEPLFGALADKDAGIRLMAVAAVLEIGGERAQQALEQLVASEKAPKVLEAAKQGLVKLSRESGLAAHWSFDDGNRKVAKDVTGNGTNGQIIGCTPAAGKVGQALRFSKGKYIELGKPDGLPIAQRPFTVMAWAKSDAPNGVVVARGGAFCGYSLYIKDGVAKFGIHREQDGPAHIAAGKDKVVGPWVHLAGVVKEKQLELYVNAKLAATAKTPGYIPGNCGQGMEIGFDVSNSPCEIIDNFEGLIDEVKVFHAALSAADITKHMAPPKKK